MIDSTLFGATIPAGTYARGDIVPLSIIDGPSVVRSGRGAAILKRLTTGILINASGSMSSWRIFVKNSDWVDPMISMCASVRETTALDEKSGSIQRGNNCALTPNSSWEVYAECQLADTTTIANSIFALIDIDYPSVSSIVDPDNLTGIPASIINTRTGVSGNAGGAITTANWQVVNVDFFKAGFAYALQKVELISGTSGVALQGFIALSNAAGMGGLKRIMPIASNPANIRNKVEYSSQLVKGPMDISVMFFDNSGTASSGNVADIIFDFVKRRTA